MESKTFELSYNRNVYFGEYFYEGNKLFIDDVHTFDSDERKVEIDSLNDSEIFSKVYSLVEKDTCSDKMDEAEYNSELRYSIAEDKADEKRKA